MRPVTRYGIILLAAFATLSAYAQQQETPRQPQDFSAVLNKAREACEALWADHAFDPIRNKFPLMGDKPTFAMLMDRTRLLPKDKPLADLAIKTVGKCRELSADAVVMLPQQTQRIIENGYREQDLLLARLYLGKITIGEYNVGISRIVTEQTKAFFGDVHPESGSASKQTSAEVVGTKSSPVQQQPQTATIQQPQQTRLALVIGNSNYKDLPKPRNPANDARAIVDTLRSLGFDVTLVADASELNIRHAVRKFADQSDQADLALVYYAGHGAQVNGDNYLLPVDMEVPHTEADIELSSLKVDDLVNSIRSPTKIVFLDACRDNPALFKNLVKGRGAIATGLAPTDASHLARIKPGGAVFIAYATDAGSIALEGEGGHSPFTQALLKYLKKPISIDDMFSFVTKEVSLVTKGMQRPYKYASLGDVVCLTGNCSAITPEPAADIVQEARRSQTDELQIALQTNNPAALQTYLEKYPESPQREKVLAEIARLKRSKFQEWTIFQVNTALVLQYMKISSIRQSGDRASFQGRFRADPNLPLFGTTKFPDGTYGEQTLVIDCKQSVMALADVKAVSASGQILGGYKWGDPDFLNLSIGQVIGPGMIGETAKNIVCNEKFRTPLVDKEQLASMSFSDLSSTSNGDGEMYDQAIQSDGIPQGQRDTIVVIRQNANAELKLGDQIAPGKNLDLGTFKTGVYWERLQCQARKIALLKSELYDASNELKSLAAADLAKELGWMEFGDTSPFALLQRILCGPREVQQ
jgi:uncharacterized caspase-like protein